MRTRVQKWGNSLALRIPRHVAQEVGLEKDASVEISIVEGKLLISRPPETEPSLEQLLERITPENIHSEVDTGLAKGNEAW